VEDLEHDRYTVAVSVRANMANMEPRFEVLVHGFDAFFANKRRAGQVLQVLLLHLLRHPLCRLLRLWKDL